MNVPKLCGLPNIHLKDAPFRPIAKLSGRQAGNKEHHVVNSMDCGKKQRSVEVLPTQQRSVEVLPDEQCRMMYRVWSSALH